MLNTVLVKLFKYIQNLIILFLYLYLFFIQRRLFITKQIGLTVMWDVGTRVYVKLQPSYRGKVCGLCGDYDGSSTNDYRSRQGLIL